MTLTDKQINEIIGDIDTTQEVEKHASEVLAGFHEGIGEALGELETVEEIMLFTAEMLEPFRPFIDMDELDPEDPEDKFLLESFALADKLNNIQ